jgi:hypothetical protein
MKRAIQVILNVNLSTGLPSSARTAEGWVIRPSDVYTDVEDAGKYTKKALVHCIKSSNT